MADNEFVATISGAALSLLFYENVREYGDQMGFFLGNVHTYVTKNVTDAERHVESTKIHTDIHGVLPCLPKDLIYGSTGKLNVKILREYVKNKKNQIVGWYRFRLSGPLYHTMRDKILHKELAHFFYGSNNEMLEHHFVSCILSYSVSNNKGTHKLRHVFLRYKDGDYPPIPLKINNLGADASRHDGSDYKPTPIKSLRNETDCFVKILDKLQLDLNRTSVIDSVPNLLKAAERQLDSLATHVSRADNEIADLEQEAVELMEKVEANRKKILRISREGKFPAGESQYQNLIKRDVEPSNRVCPSDESATKVSRTLDSKKKNSTSSMNISNICHNTGSMKKSPSTHISYSDATKKQHDTDC